MKEHLIQTLGFCTEPWISELHCNPYFILNKISDSNLRNIYTKYWVI